MQCSHLVMKPVPVEQMISQPEPAAAAGGERRINALFLLKVLAGMSSSDQVWFCRLLCLFFSFLGQVAVKPAHHAAASKKETDMLLYTNNKCPECQTQFGSKEEVSDHFQEVKPAKSTVSFTYVLYCKTKVKLIRWRTNGVRFLKPKTITFVLFAIDWSKLLLRGGLCLLSPH